MNLDQLNSISSNEVLGLLNKQLPIENALIRDKLILLDVGDFSSKGLNISVPITFRNCRISNLDAIDCGFTAHFTMSDCIIELASFEPSYFLGGATFSSCEFLTDVGLLSTGDTGENEPFSLINCVFRGFANFFDAHFGGPVLISGCTFMKGSNLFGNKGQPYRASFDVAPSLQNNIGKMDVDEDNLYLNYPHKELVEHYRHERNDL
jgi:hypothetical protein